VVIPAVAVIPVAVVIPAAGIPVVAAIPAAAATQAGVIEAAVTPVEAGRRPPAARLLLRVASREPHGIPNDRCDA
jgi:hypothetical protein